MDVPACSLFGSAEMLKRLATGHLSQYDLGDIFACQD